MSWAKLQREERDRIAWVIQEKLNEERGEKFATGSDAKGRR